jgi:glycosyltransferase involved in cell wall biosynthesis
VSEITLKVLVLHEPLLMGSNETLHSQARNVPRNKDLYAAEYMVQNSVEVDICKHSKNEILKEITKPFLSLFLNFPDAISNCRDYNMYDVLFSISDYDALAPEFFRRIIHSKTPHVATCYGITNLLLASPRARHIKKLARLDRLYKYLLREITFLLFYSRNQMLSMRKILDIPASRTRFVPLCVDTDYFRPQYGTDNYVLSVGRDHGRDYHTLLHAFKNLDGQLQIVSGRNNLRGEGTFGNVRATVDIPYASLRNMYRDAKFIVLPVRNYQSLSGQTVLLESLAMGKAVIATKCWGTQDYMVDGKTGFFVDAGDEAELRKKIHYLLEEPEVAESVGKNARQFVERECNLETYSRNLLKLLKDAGNLPP